MNKYLAGLAATSLLLVATTAFAHPGRVIIGFAGDQMAITDEGTIYTDELAELGMAGVSDVSIVLKITSDRGRMYEAQIADGRECTLQYDAAGNVEAVECRLDNR